MAAHQAEENKACEVDKQMKWMRQPKTIQVPSNSITDPHPYLRCHCATININSTSFQETRGQVGNKKNPVITPDTIENQKTQRTNMRTWIDHMSQQIPLNNYKKSSM